MIVCIYDLNTNCKLDYLQVSRPLFLEKYMLCDFLRIFLYIVRVVICAFLHNYTLLEHTCMHY